MPLNNQVGFIQPRNYYNKGLKPLVLVILWMLLVGCGVLNDSAPTPIVITATIPRQVIIVTNTPSPSPSPVLAPTLPITPNSNDPVRQLETQAALRATSTVSITLTPTFTVTPTDTPATLGAVFQPVGGVALVNGGSCPTLPSGGFGEIFSQNADLATQLGCPIGSGQARSVSNAFQTYERGVMVWVSSLGETGQAGIYVFYNSGNYQRLNDTWVDGIDPISGNNAPPAGLTEPIRGFGKIWREISGVRDRLGWATSGENGGSAFVQVFERGEMLYVPQNGQTYILTQPDSWTSLARPF